MSITKSAFWMGASLVTLGILGNKWTIELLISPIGHIYSPLSILIIVLFQILTIGIGLYLIIRKPNIPYREILITGVSITFSLTLAEIGVRTWLYQFAKKDQLRKYQLYTEVSPQSMQWSPHHYLNYYPTPNYRNGLTSHNSLGYRGKEFSKHKPKGLYRIVVLGGSTTYTIDVDDDEKTFPSQLERILKNTCDYKAIEVINGGVGGYNSWESLINLEFRVLDLDPDMLIIYHGTNDVHARLVSPQSYRGDNSGQRKQWDPPHIPYLVKKSYLLRIVSKKLGLGIFSRVGVESFVNTSTYQGAGSQNPSIDPLQLLAANPPIFFERNLLNMTAITRAHGIDIILSTWAHSPYFDDYASTPHYQSGFKEHNDVVRRLATKEKVHLFDFEKVMPKDKKYWDDGRHVNEEGALVKAGLFSDFICGIKKEALMSKTRLD